MKTSLGIPRPADAPRLRLTLASLERQDALDEVVVVDDGSTDETPAILAAARDALPLFLVRYDDPRGRSAASNAGAHAASGDILIRC